MPNTPRTIFNEIDLSFVPGSPALGISCIIGESKRGPINDGSRIWTDWNQFRKLHGGYVAGNFCPLDLKRALDRGSAIRFINIKHYSDINAGTLAATAATAANSSLVALSVPLIAGVTLNITVNGTLKTQLFSVSHDVTLSLICTQLKTLTAVVEDAYNQGNNTVIIIPKPGVVFTTTSTATGTGAPTIVVTTENTLEDASNNELFALAPLYPGVDYSNVVYKILPASNGDSNAFNIVVYHTVDTDIVETYQNLKIIGTPTIAQSNYLDEIRSKSNLVTPVYRDLSAIVATQIPVRLWAGRLTGGSDGGATVDADYIGASSSKTGLYALDGYSDISQFSIPEKSTVAILQGASAYADARKDLKFYGYLGNFTTEAAAASARDNTLIDSSYTQLYAQCIQINDPLSKSQPAATIQPSPMGDVLGLTDYSSGKFGPWISPAGQKRGKLFNVLSVPNNFATNGNVVNLDMLANKQINLVANEDGIIYIKGNFTAQKDLSALSFGSIRAFLIYLKKSLGPVLKTFIEDPCDIPTWKQIYLTVQPLLNGFGTKRALSGEENVGWVWQGDQFAKDLTASSLRVNNPTDIGIGKYKARLFLKTITPLQLFGIDIVITPSGVSFEDLLDTISPL